MSAEESNSIAETSSSCERCGSFEVVEIAGKFLCTDCVALAGCGCAGHSGD